MGVLEVSIFLNKNKVYLVFFKLSNAKNVMNKTHKSVLNVKKDFYYIKMNVIIVVNKITKIAKNVKMTI